MALSADSILTTDIGEFIELPVKASAVIYEGSAVGLTSGYARALAAGDLFVGHAFEAVTGSGSDGGKVVKVRTGRYRLQVTLASVAVTDVGKDVYMSADNTYTLTQGSNSFVGKVAKHVTTNTCIVEFDAVSGGADVPNHQHTASTDGGALTSPRVVTSVKDTNGATLLGVTATASADNYLGLANNKTTTSPALTVAGASTNIGLGLKPKGTGVVSIAGAARVDGNLTFGDAKNVAFGTTTGTKVGTDSAQKLGFYGVTPVVKQNHIANATSTATSCATQLNLLLALVETLGFAKTS